MVNPITAVFLFAGNDSYSKELAIKKLEVSLLGGSAREFDYKVFDGNSAQARDILDHILTVPFLASRRLVVIKNFEKLSPEDSARLIGYIKAPLKSTCLVIDAADDSVIRKNPSISRFVAVTSFRRPGDAQFLARSREMLSSIDKNKRISTEAAGALSELCGEDMGSVFQELQKLSAFTGNRAGIESDDVWEITGKNMSVSAFDLTDAIEANDLKGALAIISELILSGKKHYEIVGLLCWQMKKLFRARMLIDNGLSDQQAANALKVAVRYHDKFFRQVNAHTLAQLESKMEVLLEADLNIKRSRLDPALALEFAVIKLCLGLR